MSSCSSSLTADLLSCGVCFEKYDSSTHVPKILSCQHTFCGSCIDSLESHDVFECPVCRNKGTTSEIRVNLLVRDIVEELLAKQDTKMCCSVHEGKECHMVCIDCKQLLCTKCVIKELQQGAHKDHDIDDVEEVMAGMKEKLSTEIEEKIADLEKTSAAAIESILQDITQHSKDVEAVVEVVQSLLSDWQDEQVLSRQSSVQDAIGKQTDLCESLKSSLEKQLEAGDFHTLVDACRSPLIEADCMPRITGVNIKLRQQDLNQLKAKLCSVCDMNQLFDDDDEHSLSSVEEESSLEEENSVEEDSSQGSELDKSLHNWTVGPQLSECPDCDAKMPLCLSRRANLFDLSRNKKFLRVVHDRRRDHNELVCETDDFIYAFSLSTNEGVSVIGGWSPNASEYRYHLNIWGDIKEWSCYKDEVTTAVASWKWKLLELRTGKGMLKFGWCQP